jgi:hypothetical protein
LGQLDSLMSFWFLHKYVPALSSKGMLREVEPQWQRMEGSPIHTGIAPTDNYRHPHICALLFPGFVHACLEMEFGRVAAGACGQLWWCLVGECAG